MIESNEHNVIRSCCHQSWGRADMISTDYVISIEDLLSLKKSNSNLLEGFQEDTTTLLQQVVPLNSSLVPAQYLSQIHFQLNTRCLSTLGFPHTGPLENFQDLQICHSSKSPGGASQNDQHTVQCHGCEKHSTY